MTRILSLIIGAALIAATAAPAIEAETLPEPEQERLPPISEMRVDKLAFRIKALENKIKGDTGFDGSRIVQTGRIQIHLLDRILDALNRIELSLVGACQDGSNR